jgi:hypothetical protein
LLVRETPLRLGQLRLLVQVAELGAVVMPPMPAIYHRPQMLTDVTDQTVNRALDLLGVELDRDLFTRWQDPPQYPPRRDRTPEENGVSGYNPAEAEDAFAALNGAP